MNIQEINAELMRLSGNHPEFYSGIIPNSKTVLGVRVPELRKLAKKIAREDYRSFLDQNPMDSLEMEMLQAFVIGYAKDELSVLLEYFRDMVPRLHDWAVCDALCQTFKVARTNQAEVYAMLMEYADSREEFPVRVTAVMLLSHFLNDTYVERAIATLDRLRADGYYAKMGIAWAVAEVMARYPEKCFAYLERCALDSWTYNKALQKMTESYRVTPENKKVLRSMKR